jgi:ankyrin repeat protein
MSDSIRDHGELFINTVVQFLKKKVPQLAAINKDDINSTYRFSRETALHYAAKYARGDITTELLKRGASFNVKDTLGR